MPAGPRASAAYAGIAPNSPQHRRVLRRLRALQCHAPVPDGVTYSAYSCRKGQQHQQGPSSLVWVAVPRHRAGSVAGSAAISACERGPAAPAGLTSLASDAAPCQRAGCVRPRGCLQRAREVPAATAGLHLSSATWRHAIGPEVIADSAAISASGKYRQHQQVYFSYGHCGAMPSCRI